jgi:hypothetical protein
LGRCQRRQELADAIAARVGIPAASPIVVVVADHLEIRCDEPRRGGAGLERPQELGDVADHTIGAGGQSRHRRRILGETHGRPAVGISVPVDDIAGLDEEGCIGLECDASNDASGAVISCAGSAVHVAEDDEGKWRALASGTTSTRAIHTRGPPPASEPLAGIPPPVPPDKPPPVELPPWPGLPAVPPVLRGPGLSAALSGPVPVPPVAASAVPPVPEVPLHPPSRARTPIPHIVNPTMPCKSPRVICNLLRSWRCQ